MDDSLRKKPIMGRDQTAFCDRHYCLIAKPDIGEAHGGAVQSDAELTAAGQRT
jgi:hypothetical protein